MLASQEHRGMMYAMSAARGDLAASALASAEIVREQKQHEFAFSSAALER